MSKIVTLKPVGNIDRRFLEDGGEETDVLSRENFLVIGTDKESRKNKKMPGSDRLNSTSVGSYPFVSGFRYYGKQSVRKTFAYNQDGYLYYIADNGTTDQLLGVFSQLAIPCFAEMRVSSSDILYFSEGISTGMYSYDGNLDNIFNKEVAVTLNFVGMLEWLDRLWGFEEDSENINFSVNLVPTDFTDATDAGTIIIGAKRGSKIMQIVLIQDYLYIFKDDSIYRINGRSPSEFSVELVVDDLGLAARHGIRKVESGVIFLGSDYEVYSFGGTKESLKQLTYKIALAGDLTKDIVPIINRDRMSQVRAIYHNKIFRMSFVENGETIAKMEYIYNAVNETDGFTRGNNVSCYIHYDKPPDKQELVTGRSDIGFMMNQYRGLNYDNQATSPTMPVKIQTKFHGLDEPRNVRVRRYWATFGVLGARDIPIKMLIDCRNAESDATSDDFKTQGETKSPTNFIHINSQTTITSRNIPRHNNSKCQSFSFYIDENINDRDLEIENFQAEVIIKNLKRSQRVHV